MSTGIGTLSRFISSEMPTLSLNILNHNGPILGPRRYG
jgi:hypothetical protein